MSQPTPARTLTTKQVQKARLVADRQDILSYLPRGGVYCEVGVAYGDFSKPIIEICTPKKFYAIDIYTIHQYPKMWGYDRLQGRTHEQFYRDRFSNEIAAERVEVLVGNSTNVLSKIAERSVDVFYIDAWHSYDAVKSELAIIKTKVSDGGWLIFNDYIMYDHVANVPYGVVAATNEFMIEENWEILFFALHPGMYCDIAIRKIES